MSFDLTDTKWGMNSYTVALVVAFGKVLVVISKKPHGKTQGQ